MTRRLGLTAANGYQIILAPATGKSFDMTQDYGCKGTDYAARYCDCSKRELLEIAEGLLNVAVFDTYDDTITAGTFYSNRSNNDIGALYQGILHGYADRLPKADKENRTLRGGNRYTWFAFDALVAALDGLERANRYVWARFRSRF